MVTEPQHLLLALIGCAIGTLIGALPGLGPVNGVALIIPCRSISTWHPRRR
ncbi:tripartite tricarboxylate transporter permease [Litchfieldella xinjiangensis]|uniref:tripartite tricarboxylate transporter permease n=1 Tax=Litchfieldella xinjiangensis TaxID=1166948 RepID=UPI003BF58057